MNIKRIAGHDLVPGRIIKDHIHVGGTEIHVPHVIISGHKPGPLLLVTAGIHNAEVGDTGCEKQAAAMASCVDTEYIVRSGCRKGGAYNIASVNGIPSVLIERGQMSLYPRAEIDTDKSDVINIMKYLGMLEGAHETYAKTQLIEHEWHSPATGCWYPEFHAGDTFFEGEKLGTIRDYFGKIIHEITATETGIIIYQCASLNILKDGPMISYGAFRQ